MKRQFLAALAASTILLPAAAAEAGTYTVISCKDPVDGSRVVADTPEGGWHSFASSESGWLPRRDFCATGGSLYAGVGVKDGGGLGSGDHQAGWRFVAPAGTTIRAVRLDWEARLHGQEAGKHKLASVTTSRGETLAQHAVSGTAGGDLQRTLDPTVSTVAVSAHCWFQGQQCGGDPQSADSEVLVRSSTMTLLDTAAPGAALTGDGTQDTEWTSEPRSFSVNANDQGGGVLRTRLLVDGQSVSTVAFPDALDSCVERGGDHRFHHPRPCSIAPPTQRLSLEPGRMAGDGSHEVAIEVEDVAGNTTDAWRATRVFDTQPPAIGEVALTGTAREGEELRCGASAAGQGVTVAYRWLRTNADGSGAQAIDRATGTAYVLTGADIGRKVRCEVTATDDGGTSTRLSELTAGPFDGGALVTEYCSGRPTGRTDDCGDFDADGTPNRLDADKDGDGVQSSADPDDFDRAKTGESQGPAGPSGADGEAPNRVTLPSVPNGVGAAPSSTLQAHFEGNGSREMRVRYGRPVVITGRLATQGGAPVGGAALDVSSQDRITGSPFVGRGTVTTGDDGTYRIVLPAGPSRLVRIGFRARTGDTTFAQTADVLVHVAASVSFRLSHRRLRNGRTLRYLGRINGPRTGHRYAEVVVRSGGSWIPVCNVRTDASGRFACAHRFTRTNRRTKYVFRARVRRQSGLPYEPGASRTRSVVVRP